MTQIIVTLEPSADTTLLRRMIDNMKGVFKTALNETANSDEFVENETSDNEKDWIKKMEYLSNNIDHSIIDMDDERTKYIMSK